MTSETAFAQHYTSTWRLLAPAMDLFIRKINLQLYEREFPVLRSDVTPARRSLINEIAFNIFCYSPEIERHASWAADALESAIYEAQRKISALKGSTALQVGPPEQIELDDCAEQVYRLRSFFGRIAGTARLELQPHFPGAGFIQTCNGDIYFDGVLFEIKAGSRAFRSVDLRQLLTYASLNHAARARPLNQIGLFNPRMGVSFRGTLDDVCLEVSGCLSAELLPEITRVISSGEFSR